MEESPTTPMPKADLQILRTRHPPATYLNQLCALLAVEGIRLTPAILATHFEDLPDKDRMLLAVEGERLIGYAHIRVLYDYRHAFFTEIVSIVVQPHRRRQGFGRRLIAATESWARQANISRLRLASDSDDSSSHAFFKALGYKQGSAKFEFMRDLA